ncbi:hypothetical protein LR48_Vigan08g041100 [Vigna angularis]|uniref:Uncharacterized protein n=1 Tax=Phaseolus angularis TaxID=3914 RepID=A0A0L9V4F7_PHAAN|nr:hypothetical protein LR48_Vigan08g041100 [Vigna angularis]
MVENPALKEKSAKWSYSLFWYGAEGPSRGAQRDRDWCMVFVLCYGGFDCVQVPLSAPDWPSALAKRKHGCMASSSGKRIKTVASKTNRGQKRKEQIYSNKFLSHMHERHFQTVQNRRLLMERKVGLIPTMVPEFERELGRRQWENSASYPSPANIVVVKEFYTNARTFGGATHEAYMSYVIADEIRHNAHAVSNKSPLGHPSLITHLCELVGVNTPTPPFERPRKEIDASYYTQYCMLDDLGIPMSAPHRSRLSEFGERSEEGERWNQKRHQKVQKEEPQLPLSGSLPLSGTQELTGDPLRGKMAAEGKKPTHALTAERYFTAERHFYGLGPNFSVIYE